MSKAYAWGQYLCNMTERRHWRVMHSGQFEYGASAPDYFDFNRNQNFFYAAGLKTANIVSAKVPNWCSLLRDFSDATGALSASGHTEVYEPVEYTTHVKWRPRIDCPYWTDEGYVWNGVQSAMYPIGASSSVVTNLMRTTALNRAKAQLNDQLIKHNADALTFLGEIREAVGLIRHPYKGAVDKVSEFLKKRKRFLKRSNSGRIIRSATLDVATDAWLETVFAVSPLFKDIAELAEAAAEAAMKRPKRVYTGKGFSGDTLATLPWVNVTGSPPLYYYGHTVHSSKAWAKCRAGCITEVPVEDTSFTGTLKRFAENAGINKANILPTFWELLPFSFVVDYFVPVGDYINSFCVVTTAVRWAYTTTGEETAKIRHIHSWSVGPSPPEGFTVSGHTGNYSSRNWSVVRSPGYSPYLEILPKLPSLRQGVNLAALSDQLTRSNSDWRRWMS